MMFRTQTGNVKIKSDGNIDPVWTFKTLIIKYPTVPPTTPLTKRSSIPYPYAYPSTAATTTLYDTMDEFLSLLSYTTALLG
jgi:hypothetical protein